MATIVNGMQQLIGHTPLMELRNIKEKFGLHANLYAKLECFNPAGSAKDRVAAQIIADAKADGTLKPGGTIIEPTSGNTGIGLAAVGAQKGYEILIVIPDSMSIERINIMKAYGATVVLTPGAEGMKGAIAKAEELHESMPGSIIAGQFVNPSNPKVHYETTGPEIYEALDGAVDVFVAGVGTGGTITGTGKYLKEKNQDVKIIAMEPAESPYLSEQKAGAHGIQGIGAGFVPEVLDTSVYDEVITVKTDDAYETMRLFGKTEGLLVGISSGGALKAAIEVAKRPEMKDKNIVVLLPDGGDRYYSLL